jgi:hypothetical protein
MAITRIPNTPFEIEYTDKKPKRRGKHRIWFTIREIDSKKSWRVYQSLAHVHVIHACFVEE